MEAWLKPMLCKPADVVPEGPEWILEPKFDGWRAVVHRAECVRLYAGRNGSDYSRRLVYIEDELLELPPDTAVDGELVGPSWGHVQSVMTAGGAVTNYHDVKLVVFDVLRLSGHDLRAVPWRDRRALLEKLIGGRFQHVSLTPTGPSTPAAYDAIVGAGGEGVVCKRQDSRYVNSRSGLWVKVKSKATCEATVVGFKQGDSWKVGSFEVELCDGGARTTVKCGTDERHQEADEHPERWLGVVIEIEHNGLSTNGIPRHPRFLRRRDDRLPERKPRTARVGREVKRMTNWMRNYGAMGDAKLLKCLRELEAGTGDATARVVQHDGDVDEHIAAAKAAAEAKGLVAA